MKTIMEERKLTEWIKTSCKLPAENEVVETKIHDGKGCRNVQRLIRRGNLWFSPVGNMYVYYTPTHWRNI